MIKRKSNMKINKNLFYYFSYLK